MWEWITNVVELWRALPLTLQAFFSLVAFVVVMGVVITVDLYRESIRYAPLPESECKRDQADEIQALDRHEQSRRVLRARFGERFTR